MDSPRDTILVIGPSASGKTETLNFLRSFVQSKGIRHEFTPLSDAQTIVEHMFKDDEHGGLFHTHPWCQGEGHSHTNDEPKFPFAVTGNRIAHGMMKDFFDRLADAPFTGALRYAEWSGGININESDSPASRTDLSFKTIGHLLKNGELNSQGLLRIAAVIHPWADSGTRLSLNDHRGLPTDEDIKFGTASWALDTTAMKIFGIDDVDAVIPLFHEARIPSIKTVRNTGDQRFLQELETHFSSIFENLQIQKEGRVMRGKER